MSIWVQETFIESKISSEESKLSSGISAIAEDITEEALAANMSTKSDVSLGVSQLAN